MPIDLVVFDVAGTTVFDGDAVHSCLERAVARAGVTTTRDAVNAVMGMPKPLAIASLVASYRGTGPSDAEVSAIYAEFERLMLDHYRLAVSVREVEGAVKVFQALRARGIKIALDTGFHRRILDAILRRLEWDSRLLDATVASDEVDHGRPDPDMVWRAMELTGVGERARVAKVGDTPADLRQGDRAGCALVVGVTSGSHTEDELARHPHTHLIASLAELLPIIDEVDAIDERAPGDVSVPLLLTPGPLTTSHGVKAAMMRDVGSRDEAFIRTVARVHDRLLALAGTSRAAGYAAVMMQGSGTFGIEAMLGTFIPRNGGRLLVVENGAYGRRMIDIARVLGIPAVAVSSPPAAPVRPDEVAASLAREPGITHVAMVHCETTTGVLNPLARVAHAVRAAGRAFLVDAMSSFGAIPIDVHALPIDALVASSNKCLEGVPGVSFVIARLAMLQASAGRSLSLDVAAQWRGFETDGQFRFTPPTHVVLALEEALVALDREGGVAGRAARYRASHERLVAGMRELGFREVVDPLNQSDVITSFYYPDDPAFVFEDFYARLRERNFVIYPGKLTDARCFRIGTIGRVYPEDISALLAAVREIVGTFTTTR
jgi:2-aminoethylphosphonate-pyruvate transaminase